MLLGGTAALPQTLHAPIGDAIGLPGQWNDGEPNSPQASTAEPGRAPIARQALVGTAR